MSLSTTIRSARASHLRPALESVIKYLRANNIDSAGKRLRLLVDTHPVSRSALAASRGETTGNQSPGLSIATLGARICLDNGELDTLAQFAKIIRERSSETSESLSPTITHIVLGLIEIGSRDSLSHAANILCSTNPEEIPHDLVEQYYSACANYSDLIAKVWSHTRYYKFPTPRGEVLVIILKRLVQNEDFGATIGLITSILRDIPPDAKLLPVEIPIEYAPQVIALGSRAGATQQSIRLWNLARQQIGDPQTPASLPQAQFFGDPGMTYSLVRHFMKLAEKKPGQLQKWHTDLLKENPSYFLETAEKVYEAFATVHGFNQIGQDAYTSADHYHVATSIACLFALNRFAPAMDALEALFRRNEIPDDQDFGIILGALARRNAGRAIQILLEAAPARIAGFAPTPYMYNIVLHHSLLQGRKEDAVRIMLHARDAGCSSLEPKSLDAILRSSLRDIEASWRENKGKDDSGPSRIERMQLFKRVVEVLNVAQHHARPSTVRAAIRTALLIRRPIIAWDIWMLAQKYRIIGKVQVRPDGTLHRQTDFGPASTWRIAKGLWSAKERGILDEARMWRMIEDLGINIPKEARENVEWEKAAEFMEQKESRETLPASLRRKASLGS